MKIGGVGKTIVFVCLSSAFLFGYEICTPNAAGNVLVPRLYGPILTMPAHLDGPLTPMSTPEGIKFMAVAQGFFFAGTTLGAVLGGQYAKLLGRKSAVKNLFLLHMLATVFEVIMRPVGAIGTSYTWGLALYDVGRFINGLAVGSSGVNALTYLLELLPNAKLRASFGLSFQLVLTIGLAVPPLLALLLDPVDMEVMDDNSIQVNPTSRLYLIYIMLTIPFLMSILNYFMCYSIPESPEFLLTQGYRNMKISKNAPPQSDTLLPSTGQHSLENVTALSPKGLAQPSPKPPQTDKSLDKAVSPSSAMSPGRLRQRATRTSATTDLSRDTESLHSVDRCISQIYEEIEKDLANTLSPSAADGLGLHPGVDELKKSISVRTGIAFPDRPAADNILDSGQAANPPPSAGSIMDDDYEHAATQPTLNVAGNAAVPPGALTTIKRDSKAARKSLLFGLALVILIQFSFINSLLATSNLQLNKTGAIPKNLISYLTFIVFVINIFVTVVSLATSDLIGRVTFLRIGSAGLIFSAILLRISLYVNRAAFETTSDEGGTGKITAGGKTLVIMSFFMFVIAYAYGIGSVMFLYLNEILPPYCRSEFMGIIVAVNWFSSGISVVAGSLITSAVLYSLMIVDSTLLGILTIFLPETKGQAFDECPFIKKDNENTEILLPSPKPQNLLDPST